MAKVNRNTSRLRIGSSVVRQAQIKASRKLDRRTKTARELEKAAHLVAREAEKQALAYFTKLGSRYPNNRVVGGYVVEIGRDNYPVVRNNARANGYNLGDLFELGTGIYGPKKRMITANSGGKMYFATKGNIKYARISGSKKKAFKIPNVIATQQVKGVPAGHILQKAAQNVARTYGWHYTPRVRF